EDARGENGERAAARAEVEDRGDVRGIADESVVLGERGHRQFADQAARDDDALIDIEGHALDIGAVDKVGGGLAGRRARLDQVEEPHALGTKEPSVEKRIKHVDRQAETLENEKGGLVERGRHAVAKGEFGGKKAADRIAQPVAWREKRFDPLVGMRLSLKWSSHAPRLCERKTCSTTCLQTLSGGLLRPCDRPRGPLGPSPDWLQPCAPGPAL